MKSKLLARRHPGYAANEPHWQFQIDTMNGGPAWIEKYIFQYFKEGEQEFKDRLKMAFFDNLSRDIVKVYTGYTFKPGVQRDTDAAPLAVQAWWKKATRGSHGKTADDFMRDLSNWAGGVSPCFVVVDMPASQVKPVTKADERQLGLKPYAYIVKPVDLLDYGVDEDGDLLWVMIREVSRDDADPFTSTGEAITRYRIWTREAWFLYEEDEKSESGLKVISNGAHALGCVPVVSVSHEKGEDAFSGHGLIDDIARKDRALANFQSQMGTLISDQAFSQLIVPDNAVVAQYNPGDAQQTQWADRARERLVEMGTKRIFTYNAEAKAPPGFISPDASQGALIASHIKSLRREIYEDALLDSEGGRSEGGAKTATERILDFAKLNAALADKAKGLEAAEREILRLVCLWAGEAVPEDLDSLVIYPREFDTKALADELAEVVGLKEVPGLGPTFWSEYAKRLVSKVLPDLSNEDMKVITDEIAAKLAAEDALPMLDAAVTASASRLVSAQSASAQAVRALRLNPEDEAKRLEAERNSEAA